MSPPKNYVWKPIEPWTVKWHKSYLPEAFAEFKKHLPDADLHRLMERSAREWSIETGVIENAFELDRGVTTALIEQGFNASLIDHQRNGLSPEQVQVILVDTKVALDGLFDFVKTSESLTTSYIRQLHQQLMRNVETYRVYFLDPATGERRPSVRKLEPGKYKGEPNNPYRDDGSVHEYCPPEAVSIQMDELVRIFNDYDSSTPAEVRAAWLHHAFTQIHPFQDGNGRVARALASLVLIKEGLPPFMVPREVKTRYIRSLEDADHGRPEALLAFFESCLYRQVVSIWRELRFDSQVEVTRESSIGEIIAAARKKLAAKHGVSPTDWGVANSNMGRLKDDAIRQVEEVARTINGYVSSVNSQFRADLSFADPSNDASASIASVEGWDSKPLPKEFKVLTVGLTIHTDSKAEILISFDSLSQMRQGLIGVAVLFRQKGGSIASEPRFFLNFKEPLPTERFKDWLNDAIKQALIRWQDQVTG